MTFGAARRARRPSLTPLIDVVFLLLVFFMLAARFGLDQTLPIALAGTGTGGTWDGAPRLVEVTPDGPRLNGVAVDLSDLGTRLAPLLPAPDAPVLVRAGEGAGMQALVDVLGVLQDTGTGTPVLVGE